MDEEERRRIYEEGRKAGSEWTRNAWILGIVFLVVVPIILNECG